MHAMPGRTTFLLLVSLLVPNALAGDGLFRYPDVSQSEIVFVYGNDLWIVPREGGDARPLASPPGPERLPRFSPDGSEIAFVGNYDGNQDIYTVNARGGTAKRLTHHTATERICDWTQDDRIIFSTNATAGLARQQQLFTISPDGGLPQQLPVPYGSNGAVSADGTWLAYTPHSRDTRSWKRYRGGMASDIWLFNLKNNKARQVTDWEGTDSFPMWHDGQLYYLSDAGPAHRLNIWLYDANSGRSKQLTNFTDFDVKWPSIGPGPNGRGEIVFQQGRSLHLLDLGSTSTKRIRVEVPGDMSLRRPRIVDAAKNISNVAISPSGKRALIEARGDIWTVPAKNGPTRNLTRTNGIAERNPAWSPDAKWIAYFADESGEYELYIRPSDGSGEQQQLTKNGAAFRYAPTWSPDSNHIAFTDKAGDIWLHSIDARQTRRIDTEPWAMPSRLAWSPDSRWITYTKGDDNYQSAVWIYEVEAQQAHRVTHGFFTDSWPTFDRDGDFLYFASNREFTSPIYEDIGTTFVYARTDRIIAVPLRDDVESPFLPENDEETWDDEEESGDDEDADEEGDDEDEADEDADEEEDTVEPIEITLEDFERRAILLPIARGNFTHLAVNDEGALLYVRQPAYEGDAGPNITIFDAHADEPEEKTVLADAGGFTISANGSHIIVRKPEGTAILEAKPDQTMEKTIPLANMHVRIDPMQEWPQLFRDAWRVQRDFFYDPTMHGVDWDNILVQYQEMLEDCASRDDLSFLIREMIAELNVGHAYYWGGDTEQVDTTNVGLLGCDFELGRTATGQPVYRISRILRAAPWDADARSPLDLPGIDADEGDYLIAVNGVPVDASKDPWAAFIGLAGQQVVLTLNEEPVHDENARDVVVEPIANETSLRYRDWVERNRAYVEAQTGGRIGYIHVPNTGIQGQNELIRQFFGQRHLPALVIDERWNGGGQIPTRFIELLNRPITNYWARRDGNDWAWPPDSHQGPKCMLINGLAGSGGDMFPALFKQAGLGKLIGTRTWGGLVGISGNPALIDGGYTSAPTFAYYERDGTWGIEGHGVDPDIEVIDDPSRMTDGGDPQLDAAIEHLNSQLERFAYRKPQRPAYPDRSGMGIVEADK